MDHEQFDTLARRLFTDRHRSRRAAIAGLLGAALLGIDPGSTFARRKGRGGRRVSAAATDQCFPGTKRAPGAGKNSSRCDFSFSTAFRNKDVRGANLSQSNFVGADLRGADLRGANASGSCFISADLSGARLGSSVNLRGAVFCNTRMPDGKIDNSGCEGATPCCHLRVHDCPNVKIGCLAKNDLGNCATNVGDFPPVGTCWNAKTWRCCPCDHPDYDYWEGQCAQTFATACSAHGCVAEDESSLWECYNLCQF
jgi:hypothetical protein